MLGLKPSLLERNILLESKTFKIIQERKGRDREQNLLLAVSLRSVHLGALHGWNWLLPLSLVVILGQVDDELAAGQWKGRRSAAASGRGRKGRRLRCGSGEVTGKVFISK